MLPLYNLSKIELSVGILQMVSSCSGGRFPFIYAPTHIYTLTRPHTHHTDVQQSNACYSYSVKSLHYFNVLGMSKLDSYYSMNRSGVKRSSVYRFTWTQVHVNGTNSKLATKHLPQLLINVNYT